MFGLADFCSEAGHTWVLIDTLVEMTCLAPRTITKALTSLERRGLLVRELREGRSSVFWLQLKVIDSVARKDRDAREAKKRKCRGTTNSGESSARGAGGSARGACITTKELPNELPNELPKNTHTPCDFAFDQFWNYWPDGLHKNYYLECRNYWRLHQLHTQAGSIMDDVHRSIVDSVESWDEGGEFLRSPLRYLKSRHWCE